MRGTDKAPRPAVVPYGLLSPVSPDWTLAPAVLDHVAWTVLSGALRLTYGTPSGTCGDGGSLSLDNPRTVDLTPSSPPFVVWAGMAVLYRAVLDGTRVLRRSAP